MAAQYYLYLALRLIHIYAAIVLVGSIIFNTIILMPSLKQVPPAQAVIVSQKIGGGLMAMGGTAIILLGVTGFTRVFMLGEAPFFFSRQVMSNPRLRWTLMMASSWFCLFVTGTLSGIWYRTILTKKLPYSAGLRDLEERRAAQERVSTWQDRLAYFNLTLALLAALGGILATT